MQEIERQRSQTDQQLLLSEVRLLRQSVTAQAQQQIYTRLSQEHSVRKTGTEAGHSGRGPANTIATAPTSIESAHSLTSQRHAERETKSSRYAFRYRIGLPYWIWKRVLDLRFEQAEMGWNATFRVYNVLPRHSPVFEACDTGDLDEVQHLFRSKQASIYDRTENDENLLEVGAQSREPFERVLRVSQLVLQSTNKDSFALIPHLVRMGLELKDLGHDYRDLWLFRA